MDYWRRGSHLSTSTFQLYIERFLWDTMGAFKWIPATETAQVELRSGQMVAPARKGLGARRAALLPLLVLAAQVEIESKN